MPDHTLVTNLFNYTLPLIRYRMADVLRPAPSGEHAPYLVIESLVGRNELQPKFKNRDGVEDFISPHTINEVFVAGVTRFQLQLTGDDAFSFMICLDTALTAEQRAAAGAGGRGALREILARKHMENVRFDVVPADDLPVNPRTRKFQLIVDRRTYRRRVTPEFRKLWLGRSVSFVGSEVTGVALPLAAVLLLDADAREMGWLVAAQNLPWIFFGLAAGVWVDRMRRKPILVATNFGQAAVLAVVPVAALLGHLDMVLLAASRVRRERSVDHRQCRRSRVLPSLLPRDQLVAANSRIQFSFSLSRAVGPGAAGVLVQWLTAPIAIVVDVVTFIVAGIADRSIRHPEAPPPRRDAHVVADILEGLKRLARDTVLRPLVICGAAHNIFTTVIVAIYVLYLTARSVSRRRYSAHPRRGRLGALLGSMVSGRLVDAGHWPCADRLTGVDGLARLLIPLADGPLLVVVACSASPNSCSAQCARSSTSRRSACGKPSPRPPI